MIITKSPWQGADSTNSTSLFISRNGEPAPAGFKGQVVKDGIKRIACMSSTYVAMLDAIGHADAITAVSGIGYINNKHVRQHADAITDIGYEGNIDYERLVSSHPDIVLLYGMNGASSMESKLTELGIPYAYIGDYLEEDPLGKAEWMVVIAELFDQRDRAKSHIDSIANLYDTVKAKACGLEPKPTVMLNTPYGDSWVMAPTSSYVARLISDAGGNYVYTANDTNRSMPIDMEEAYTLANASDVWINTGQYDNAAQLAKQFPKLAAARPIANGQVWNFSRLQSPGGGNDYWESGSINPHLVLTDLAKIFHPDAFANEPFTYYQNISSRQQ